MSLFDRETVTYTVTLAAPYNDHLAERETLGQAMVKAWEIGRRLANPKALTIWRSENHGGSSTLTAIINVTFPGSGDVKFEELS